MGSSAAGPEYVLGRNSLASVRLNLLHNEIKDALGYLLHPSIDCNYAEATICDMGTGTGIWLSDLAKASPKASLYGLDIDLSQAPPPEWQPSNVTLRQQNVFDPIPEDLKGKFDVVHVQLFMLVVKNNDPRPVLDNLLKLLKPGGWLQWVELDLSSEAYHRANDSVSMDKLVDVAEFQKKLVASDPRLMPTWVSNLGSVFKEAGLEVTADQLVGNHPSHRPLFTDLMFMTFHEFAVHLRGEIGETFRRMLHEAEEEFASAKRRIAVSVDNRIVVGQKPK